MRSALLLATALVPFLIDPAQAAVSPEQAQARPTSGDTVQADVAPKAPPSKPVQPPAAKPRPVVVKPREAVPALNAGAPALLPRPVVIESMDLSQVGQRPVTFTIPQPAVPAPAAAPAAAEARVIQSAPLPAETVAPMAAIVQRGVHIEPVGGQEPAILLRAEAEVGLAAFRAGSEVIVILDAPITFQAPGSDLDPAFARLTSRPTQDATVIRIPLASGALRTTRQGRGWLITLGPPTASPAVILPRLNKAAGSGGSFRLPAADPSRVVIVLDPRTGDRLLVGTQTSAGQAVPNEWHQDQFTLLPTLQGVVVAAISDDIRLRQVADGFTLSNSLRADSAIAVAQDPGPDRPIAGALSRLFDIPNGTISELDSELNRRIIAAGNAHALARSAPRLRVAEAMLGLGMDVEAQSLVEFAATADPALVDMPRSIGLKAVAATLAGRLEDARTLADPRLDGSTEVELWRALLQVAKDEPSASDARSLADGLPLILAYPSPLRNRLLPVALEAMALNGQAEAAQALMKTLPADQSLDFARALALEMTAKPADALKAYDQVAGRADRLPRYKAQVRAAELRIKDGQIDARAGAEALDRALLGWRAPKQELALRLRIADLRRQAGQWREALTVLRDGREVFPEDRAQIEQKMSSIFTALLTDDAAKHLAPADFVALYDQNRDLVDDIAWTEKSGSDLVDRLVGLDLQGRAEPVMSRLVAQSTDPVRRAALGGRLAALRMTMNDAAGAIAALSSTAPAAGVTLPVSVMQNRQLLYARGELGRGNTDTALGMLNALDTSESDRLRAQIYTSRRDWPNTVAALTALERKEISTTEISPAQQAIVMRLAVAAELGGDTATIARLTASYGPAMAKGSSASLFRVVTSSPARGTGDLPRAFEEIQLARQLIDRI